MGIIETAADLIQDEDERDEWLTLAREFFEMKARANEACTHKEAIDFANEMLSLNKSEQE